MKYVWRCKQMFEGYWARLSPCMNQLMFCWMVGSDGLRTMGGETFRLHSLWPEIWQQISNCSMVNAQKSVRVVRIYRSCVPYLYSAMIVYTCRPPTPNNPESGGPPSLSRLPHPHFYASVGRLIQRTSLWWDHPAMYHLHQPLSRCIVSMLKLRGWRDTGP